MKELKDMTLEELWALFPIILREHNPQYRSWFDEEARGLRRLIGDEAVFRVSHIGSTAVPGLLAKPTVDILLEVNSGMDEETLIGILSRGGWTLMARGKKAGQIASFNKGYTPAGFAPKVFHLHARRPGDWDEPYFRDYLREHPETAKEYAALKRSLFERFEHDRDGYTEAKTDFVRRYSALAKKAHPGKYAPHR